MTDLEPKKGWLAGKRETQLGRLEFWSGISWISIGLLWMAFNIARFRFAASHPAVFGPWSGLCFPLLIFCAGLVVFALKRRILRAARASNFRTCKHCTYDLREIEEPGPCPECGRAFNAGELRVYWETQLR